MFVFDFFFFYIDKEILLCVIHRDFMKRTIRHVENELNFFLMFSLHSFPFIYLHIFTVPIC